MVSYLMLPSPAIFAEQAHPSRLTCGPPARQAVYTPPMADVFTPQKRSEVMSRIRGRGNRSTELCFASLLRQHHLTGWRRHLPLPGRPDFTFPKVRICVFVHGCFWHGCPACATFPKHRARYWRNKILGNRRRDRRVCRQLRARGYAVLTVWECALERRKTGRSLSLLKRLLVQPALNAPRETASAP